MGAKYQESYRVYSCPNCGLRHCSHKTTNYWIHVGPPIQECAKCQTEFRVDTAQEWELLTSEERSRYKQQVGFETFIKLFGAALLSGVITGGTVLLCEQLKIKASDKIFQSLLIGSFSILSLLAFSGIYRAWRGVRESKKRTLDPVHRARSEPLKPWYT
jgi:hypothetical protein